MSEGVRVHQSITVQRQIWAVENVNIDCQCVCRDIIHKAVRFLMFDTFTFQNWPANAQWGMRYLWTLDIPLEVLSSFLIPDLCDTCDMSLSNAADQVSSEAWVRTQILEKGDQFLLIIFYRVFIEYTSFVLCLHVYLSNIARRAHAYASLVIFLIWIQPCIFCKERF